MAASTGPVIDATTIGSLSFCFSLFVVAYALSLRLLPKNASGRSRAFFIWHSYDSLIHFIFEGSFLYNCFFTFDQLPGPPSYTSQTHPVLTPPGVYFLGHKTRLYGAGYGTGPTAKLWQEYGKADKRWNGADLTVISLELLTVFIGGPLAAYIAYLFCKGHGDQPTSAQSKTRLSGKISFWMIVLATGELYGGFMTFAPEWLSGNANLDTSNWMYLWLYLTFFNMIWVFVPLYALVQSYGSIAGPPVNTAALKKTL